MEEMIPRPKAPCKDCKERKEHCHSKCKKYITYRKDMDKYNALIRKNKGVV